MAKKIFLVILIIACFAGVCYVNTDEYKLEHYEFTGKQVKLLNSLGINETKMVYKYDVKENTIILRPGTYVDEDLIRVKMDKKFAIEEIAIYGLRNKILYKDGEVICKFSPKAESNKAIAEFISTYGAKYNQVTKWTIVDTPPDVYPFGHNGIYNFLSYMGKDDEYEGATLLNIYSVLHYSGRDWIDFNKVIFSNKSNSWTYYVPSRPEHQVVRGGVHEYITVSFFDILHGMRLLADGENPQIDFVGPQYKKTVSLDAADIQKINEYIKLADRL